MLASGMGAGSGAGCAGAAGVRYSTLWVGSNFMTVGNVQPYRYVLTWLMQASLSSSVYGKHSSCTFMILSRDRIHNVWILFEPFTDNIDWYIVVQ